MKKAREAGFLALVVGPSGAGKDTLMNAVRARLGADPRYHFAQRMITRPLDGVTEDHSPISEADYERLVASGQTMLAWRAHGLGYILPAALKDNLARGETVIANGSRKAIPLAHKVCDRVLILVITAPRAVLAERLAARGRESPAEIERRLDRANLDAPIPSSAVMIENTGTVSQGVARILSALESFRQGAGVAEKASAGE